MRLPRGRQRPRASFRRAVDLDFDVVGQVVRGIPVGVEANVPPLRALRVDELALGDPLLARLKPADIQEWHIAHFKRKLPEGYDQTFVQDKNKIADPALAEYYDKLALIIRGDIWSLERWEAIWKMNTGQYDHLLEAYTNTPK